MKSSHTYTYVCIYSQCRLLKSVHNDIEFENAHHEYENDTKRKCVRLLIIYASVTTCLPPYCF